MGLVNGIGVGIFRFHPLIMTLTLGLVVLGLVNVYQVATITAGQFVLDAIAWVGGGTSFGFVPNGLIVFVPLAVVILFGLRRTGYGRLLYAIGGNDHAARLSGVRVWQVLIVPYVIAALLAGLAGIMLAGLTKVASATLAERLLRPSVAAAVVGGTSIYGGRGGYAGGFAPDPVRRGRARRGRGLHAHHPGVGG